MDIPDEELKKYVITNRYTLTYFVDDGIEHGVVLLLIDPETTAFDIFVAVRRHYVWKLNEGRVGEDQ